MSVDTSFIDKKMVENIQDLSNTLLSYPTREERFNNLVKTLIGITVIIGEADTHSITNTLATTLIVVQQQPDVIQRMKDDITWEEPQNV